MKTMAMMKKNKTDKMFDVDNLEHKMNLSIFNAGYNAAVFEDEDDELVEELMGDPEFRVRHISSVTNAALDFFSSFKRCEENQYEFFCFIGYLTDIRYREIPEEVVNKAFGE